MSDTAETETFYKTEYRIEHAAWFVPLASFLILGFLEFFLVRLCFVLYQSDLRPWVCSLTSVFSIISLIQLVLFFIGILVSSRGKIERKLLSIVIMLSIVSIVLLVLVLVVVVVAIVIARDLLRSMTVEIISNAVTLFLLVLMNAVFIYHLFKLDIVSEEKCARVTRSARRAEVEEKESLKIEKPRRKIETVLEAAGQEAKSRKTSEAAKTLAKLPERPSVGGSSELPAGGSSEPPEGGSEETPEGGSEESPEKSSAERCERVSAGPRKSRKSIFRLKAREFEQGKSAESKVAEEGEESKEEKAAEKSERSAERAKLAGIEKAEKGKSGIFRLSRKNVR